MRSIRKLALAAAIFVAAAGAAHADESAEPSLARLTGFGAAKFGSSIDEVRVVWPKMYPISDTEKMPSAAFSSPHLQRFLIKDHVLAGLASPVDVEFRFWKEQLWAFLVYFEPADTEAALKYLSQTYGPRTTGTDERPIWRGETATLQTMPKAGWFGATNNALSDEARAWFFKALTGNEEGNGPAAAPAVAASPVPTAPASSTPAAAPAAP